MVKRIPQLVKNAKFLRKNQTVWERKLWYHLRKKNFGGFRFRRQVPVESYIADFCCNRAKLIIELDGSGHQNSSADKIRDHFFENLGYKVLRFWNNELDNNMEGVLERIKEQIDER